jgi:predicted N-acetyltransferase YhbS
MNFTRTWWGRLIKKLLLGHTYDCRDANMITIRTATPDDYAAIDELILIGAFNFNTELRKLVTDLRAGGYFRLELVATTQKSVVGYIAFASVNISAERGVFKAMAMLPEIVHPSHKDDGSNLNIWNFSNTAIHLVEKGILQCREAGYAVLLAPGGMRYEHFGFSSQYSRYQLRHRGSKPYGPHRAMELEPGALSDVCWVEYPPPFIDYFEYFD